MGRLLFPPPRGVAPEVPTTVADVPLIALKTGVMNDDAGEPDPEQVGNEVDVTDDVALDVVDVDANSDEFYVDLPRELFLLINNTWEFEQVKGKHVQILMLLHLIFISLITSISINFPALG